MNKTNFSSSPTNPESVEKLNSDVAASILQNTSPQRIGQVRSLEAVSSAFLDRETSEKIQQIFNSYLSCGMPVTKISSKGQTGFSNDCSDLITEFVLSEDPAQVDEFIAEVETHIFQTVNQFERSFVFCNNFLLLQRNESLAAFISRWAFTGRKYGLSVLVVSSDPE
jgi:hypothetical protein